MREDGLSVIGTTISIRTTAIWEREKEIIQMGKRRETVEKAHYRLSRVDWWASAVKRTLVG